MKHVFMKRLLIAGIALLTVPALGLAQKEKEENVKTDKKDIQTIVITRTGDKDEKMVVEIKGDKVMVNGKDAKEIKDVNVHVNVNTNSIPRVIGYGRNGDAFTFNGDNFSIFSEDENRAMLGVTTQGDDKGAEILSVTKESAAEKAGLKKGDIITKVGDNKIEDSDDVTTAIRKQKPGDKVAITYLREGKEQKATAELTKWRGVQINAIRTMPQMQGLERQMEGLNLQLEGLNRQQWNGNAPFVTGRPRLGLSIQDTEDGSGVKVLDVDDESMAAKAGIKKDDIILGVDDTNVKGTEDVVRATRGNQDKASYKFKVKRGNNTQTIEVKIPRRLKTADL